MSNKSNEPKEFTADLVMDLIDWIKVQQAIFGARHFADNSSEEMLNEYLRVLKESGQKRLY